MTTHSSILAWEIPQSEIWLSTVLGVLTVRHNLVTKPPPPHTVGDIARVTYSQGLLLQTGTQLGIHADDRQFQVHLLELSISFPYVSRKHPEMAARMAES